MRVYTTEPEDRIRFYERVLAHLPDIIACFDRHLRHTYISPSIEALTGLAPELFLGKTHRDLALSEQMSAVWEAALQRAFMQQERQQIIFTYVGANDTELVYESTLIPELGADGEVKSVISISHDISERVRAEQKLQADQERRIIMERRLQENQRLESLGVLAGGVAHDFNNILTGIIGNAALAMADGALSDEVRGELHDIINSSQRAADLTRQMLIYAGRGPLMTELLAINDIIHGMADLIRVSITPSATLRYQFAEGLPLLGADMRQIRQALLSLVVNAAEALAQQGGTITIFTAGAELSREALDQLHLGNGLTPGYYVSMGVSDTGSGIAREIHERIFEPFFSTRFMGRGLGLATVHGIARAHQGAIGVESRPGVGTTLQIWLPACMPETHNPREATPDRERHSILVIDDEEMVCRVTARLLERIGYRPYMAGDALHALALLRNGLPDLVAIVLDLTMPHMAPSEAIRAIHMQRPDLPIVLMSGYNADEAERRLDGVGVTAFLQKPFSLDQLRTTIGKAVMHRSRMQAG